MEDQDLYERYREVRTGDVMLFSSWSITSMITKAATWSEWTHAGIAVWLKTKRGRELYVFEAGTDAEYDALSGTHGSGCRLVNLVQIVGRYNKIAFRRVRAVRDGMFERLKEFMKEHKGIPFRPMIKLALLSSGISKKLPDDDGTIFCSELVSKWLLRSGAVSSAHFDSHPHCTMVPEFYTDDLRFPEGTFEGPVVLVHDDRLDGAIRTWLFAIQMCSFFTYLLLTIDDEKGYRSGRRRGKKGKARRE
jgi:hypothetical protein